MKEIVQLRSRADKSGGEYLYLCYTLNGVRHYESLKMHLLPETDAKAKKANRATMEAARTMQSRRIVEIQEGKAMIKRNRSTSMVQYFNQYIKEHSSSDNYIKAMKFALKQWTSVFGENKTLESISKNDMKKLSSHLRKSLKESSGAHYYNIISTVLQSAWRDGIIDMNPAKMLDKSEKPKMKSVEREFLTIDEIGKLAETACNNDNLKRAFLFSCFTGLRLSDVKTLEWKMIHDNTIVKEMVKTGDTIRIPLSSNAQAWLPVKNDGRVFIINSERQMGRDLREWVKDAGIDKHITFHCARHTFACLLLTYGSDIYTTSKLLGHANIATTEIYAHLVDKKREEAVNLIPEIK